MAIRRKEYIHYLLLQYLEGKASPSELEQLTHLLKNEQEAIPWEELMEEIFEAEPAASQYHTSDWQQVIEEILSQTRQPGSIPIRRYVWKRIAVAASVIFLLGFATYFLFFNKAGSRLTTHDSRLASQDVAAPQTNHATITLADGKKIFLDSTSNGQLATQNNVSIIKTEDGKINYQLTANSQQLTAQYNTLTNLRGSKVIDMTLADGSRVWLNAGSSITYPVAFMNNERKVSITGEAYFEVKHNDKMPFTVSANGVEVQDIGTSFNINAYDDEDAIRVTLLDGSVKVSRLPTSDSRLLTPGQQAVVIQHSTFNIQNNIDIDKVMAWKNGEFYFEDDNLEEIMQQLSSWYNIQPHFTMPVSGYTATYTGRINRNVPISEVLAMFEKLGYVNFEIKGNVVTIIPVK